MKTKMRRIAHISMVGLIFILCSCKRTVIDDATTSSESTEYNTEEKNNDDNNTDSTSELLFTRPDDKEWKAAYMDYLSEFVVKNNLYNMCEYYLIYVDDNDVPELFIDTGIEASGEYVVTYYKNETIEKHLDRIGSEFIERSGLILTNTGHMGYLPLTITKLENGSFTVVAEGLCVWSNEGTDEQTVTCEWEGESVSMDEFEKNLGEIYDKEKSLRPDDGYTFDEMVSILSTEE